MIFEIDLDLRYRFEKLTPRNSSLPPSTEHPHAKPKRKALLGKNRLPESLTLGQRLESLCFGGSKFQSCLGTPRSLLSR